jgi:ABC-type glycerol-3-phosphate transport system substrate-binding protein
MKKRLLATLLITVLMALTLTACGGDSQDADSTQGSTAEPTVKETDKEADKETEAEA